ncbi:hypothetical protein E2C01_012190 [Portunus trituberculatus]|uniref:Uncharacterized protein n=1 Tax=Portunus trituberculatus TaxID=210409 RepID=A0A5B7DDA1_PORTR|nr:hypothetical protein [Portunus trituberculatus]
MYLAYGLSSDCERLQEVIIISIISVLESWRRSSGPTTVFSSPAAVASTTTTTPTPPASTVRRKGTSTSGSTSIPSSTSG